MEIALFRANIASPLWGLDAGGVTYGIYKPIELARPIHCEKASSNNRFIHIHGRDPYAHVPSPTTLGRPMSPKKLRSSEGESLAPQKKKKIRLEERVGANQAPIGDLGTKTSQAAAVGAPRSDLGVQDAAERGAAVVPVVDGRGSAATSDSAGGTSARGRPWTVSVALPGSIVDNAQTHELRSHLVGQVARACAIFNVDEIVVFTTDSARASSRDPSAHGGKGSGGRSKSDGTVFMARLLQYIECPQYLRKHIFPVHPDLRCAGLLAPLDAPHHLRIDEPCEYREAVVVSPGSTARRGAQANPAAGPDGTVENAEEVTDAPHESGMSESVYTGLRKELRIGRTLPVGTRVTVRMPPPNSSNARSATVVPPREPREAAGMYWGYDVRVANGLAAVWSECPYEGGYDLSLGTSEHGAPVAPSERALELPSFRHLIIVFGGVEGLEPAVAAEDLLADCEDDVPSLFDHYLNLCPGQGSRTIRTEEALLVGLAALRPSIERAACR